MRNHDFPRVDPPGHRFHDVLHCESFRAERITFARALRRLLSLRPKTAICMTLRVAVAVARSATVASRSAMSRWPKPPSDKPHSESPSCRKQSRREGCRCEASYCRLLDRLSSAAVYGYRKFLWASLFLKSMGRVFVAVVWRSTGAVRVMVRWSIFDLMGSSSTVLKEVDIIHRRFCLRVHYRTKAL